MSRDGSGTYTLPAVINPVVAGDTITASWANTTLDDVATELTNSIDKSGRTTLTADLPMGGFTLTGLAAGAADGESVRYEQVQRNGTASIASAATVDLDVPEGTITITGNTGPITSFGTTAETGQVKQVIFASTPTVTHNATSMILPTGASLTATAGDTALFVHAGSGNWKCLNWSRSDGSTFAAPTFGDGTVGTPGLRFTSDTNTGLYRIGADNLGIAAGGVKVADIKPDVATYGTTAASGTTTLTLEAAGTSTGSSALALNASSVGANGNITATAKTAATISAPSVILKDGTTNRVTVSTTTVTFTGLLKATSGGILSSGGGISMSGSSTCCEGTLSSSTPTTISISWGVTYSSSPIVVLSYVGSDVRITAKTVTTTGMDVTFSATPADGDTLSWICMEP